MSIEGWFAMLKEGSMIDSKFTQREATYIFVRVNIADELFAPELKEDSEAAATVDEFELMVARLAREKVPDSNEPLETTLDSFINLIFTPAYRAALKRRGAFVPMPPHVPAKPAEGAQAG